MTLRRRLPALSLAAGLAATAAVVPSASPAVAAIGSCAEKTGVDDFYPGPSASEVYDDTFRQGPAIPDLPRYTPQGLATWNNWDGKGNDLLVLGSYWKEHRSRLYGIDPETGRRVGSVYVAESHLGGIGIAKGWLIAQHVQGNSRGSVRKYKLSDLRRKLLADGTPYLARSGRIQSVYSAEFMGSYGGSVWAGHYNRNATDKMYQYRVNSDGSLTRVGSAWEVPKKTQGVLVTSNRFVFSSSDGTDRGRITVATRAHDLDDATGRCFRSPSMSEGITAVNGTAYVAFEGASSLYRETARNVVKHLHKTPVGALGALTNP